MQVWAWPRGPLDPPTSSVGRLEASGSGEHAGTVPAGTLHICIDEACLGVSKAHVPIGRRNTRYVYLFRE